MLLCAAGVPGRRTFRCAQRLCCEAGGAGSAVNEYLAAIKADVTILNLGIPDEFIKHGTQDEMHAEMGLDANGILTSIKAFMA